jgi:DnaJ-class molecular chaperone
MPLLEKKLPPNPTRLCRRCLGSGQLLRPIDDKVLNFLKCSDCQGHGVRFNDSQKSAD